MARKIDNTTERMKDPAEKLLFLAEAMDGSPIERQERDGQRQLVNSDRLPTDIGRHDCGEFEALGFTFGDPDPDDPMFRAATLPEGWKREGSDHAMWSYIVDQHGRKRVAIFYKAAFYDRRAFMRLEHIDSYVRNHVEYGGPLVLTDEWATPETVAESLSRLHQEQLDEAAKFRRYAQEQHRDEKNRADLRRIAGDYDERGAKYEAALQTAVPMERRS